MCYPSKNLIKQDPSDNRKSFPCYILNFLDEQLCDEVFWFSGEDIAAFLGYIRSEEAIENCVKPECKKTWSEIEIYVGAQLPTTPLPWNIKPETIFISQEGLQALVDESIFPEEAEELRMWVFESVVPLIDGNFLLGRISVVKATFLK